MNLVIHPKSQKILETLKKDLPQSLLLTGEVGVGLSTIASSLSGNVLAVLEPVNSKGEIDHEGGLISVEMIRRLYEQTRAKQTSSRIVLIDDADRLSPGAQAAFLKLLEEPNEHIHFVLTSHHPQKILPTIHSRVTRCIIHPTSKEETLRYIKASAIGDSKKEAQLMFIAQGLPAELARLMADEAYFAKKAAYTSHARDFLQGQPYEKMRIIQQYKSDREASIEFIDSALRILRQSLLAHPQQTIISQLDALLDVRENLLMNFNVGLQLARLAL